VEKYDFKRLKNDYCLVENKTTLKDLKTTMV